MSDPEVIIENYEVYRADRKNSLPIGSLIYSHQKLAITFDTMIDNVCEGIICKRTAHKFNLCCFIAPKHERNISFCRGGGKDL